MILRRPATCILVLVALASMDFSTCESTKPGRSKGITPVTPTLPEDVSRQNRENHHGHHYHTDSVYSEPTSRRTYTSGQQQPAQGMLIEQDGVLIYVPPPPQDGSDQRSHGWGDGDGDGDGDVDDGGDQWGNNSNKDNDEVYEDDNDEYGEDDDAILRPEGDDAVDQELDCSQFLGLDDPPIECLSQGAQGGDPWGSGGGSSPAYGNSTNYNNTYDQFPTNGSALQPQYPPTGDGVQGDQPPYGDNMTAGTGMVGTTLVDDDGEWGDGYNSSDSYDGNGNQEQGSRGYPPENLITIQIGVAMDPAPSNLDPMNRIVSEVVTGILDAQTSFNSIYLGNVDPPIDYRQRQLANREESFKQEQLLPQQSRDQRQLEEHTDGQRPPPGSSSKHPPVDLVHAWTIMELTLVDDNNSSMVWFWTSISYAALIGLPENNDSTSSSESYPPPRPIRRQDHIGNITYMCQLTINRTIDNDLLLYRLVDAIEDTISNAYDRHSVDATWLSNQLGLQAVAPLGITGLGEPAYVKDLKTRPHSNYRTPLDLEFGLREWLGLGLAIGTVFVTLLIFGGASYYRQRQDKKQWSTALMTEHGINDILKVGWQYHQQTGPPTGPPSQPQLFLHIFEKQAFRSDDDSLLHGGVEREEVAHTGGILLVHDEGSREDDSSSSNRNPSSRASGEQTQPTTQPSMDTKSKR